MDHALIAEPPAEAPLLRRSFDLLHWFALLSLICITLTGIGSAVFMSRFLTDNMLRREAEVSLEFIESIVHAENTDEYFIGREDGTSSRVLSSFFKHISLMPDVVRANVYAQDHSVLWSSDEALIGRRFTGNDDLVEALQGRLEVVVGLVDQGKPEHVGFGSDMHFIEAYIPIWSRDHAQVVGAVEIYKLPRALAETIRSGTRLVWACTGLGALVLYTALFWIIWWARKMVRRQQAQMVESETMAAVGEMASAVVHGIRNPLASIRSSAEFMQGEDLSSAREAAGDIIGEVDRLDSWVRDLLRHTKAEGISSEEVDVRRIVRESLQAFAPTLQRRSIKLSIEAQATLPPIRANAASLTQVFSSLVTNAVEAMPQGGNLDVLIRRDDLYQVVEVSIVDTGPGMSPELIRQIFERHVTTKPAGIGLGLSLGRRILSRYGGTLQIASTESKGTTATIRLPVAR